MNSLAPLPGQGSSRAYSTSVFLEAIPRMSEAETPPSRGSHPAATSALGPTGQPDRPSQAVGGGRTVRSSSPVAGSYSTARGSQAGQLASQSAATSPRPDNTLGVTPPGAEPAGRPSSALGEEDAKRPVPMTGAVSQPATQPAAPPTARLDATRSVALRPGPASAASVTRSTAAPAPARLPAPATKSATAGHVARPVVSPSQ